MPTTLSGLDVILRRFPSQLRGKRVGVLCHASSITLSYTHIVDALSARSDCTLSAIFGPQHGLFGQTQDNMIEWQGYKHPTLGIPVYSLYGEVRKPSREMLAGLDALVIDLQDVGARPYTYIWTVKQCLQACGEAGLPVWVLDRPNPIGAVPLDGPLLRPDHFSFVGAAEIPLCHRLTLGEMALLLKKRYVPKVSLNVVWMEKWWRNSLWPDTELPWVLPSPNMPAVETAIVYPGMVLLEATNVSEGRGTTRPFEIFGAPYLDMKTFMKDMAGRQLPGCVLREQGFIPTFQKWEGINCQGAQVHVTDPAVYEPAFTAACALAAARNAGKGAFQFKPPPYEYEAHKMPVDILWGNQELRACIEQGGDPAALRSQWREQCAEFWKSIKDMLHYPEEPA